MILATVELARGSLDVWTFNAGTFDGSQKEAKRDSSHALADAFAGANGKEKVGLLRWE
jgi:hypothetical protein